MIDAIYIASAGMHAEQSNIDTISNNVSNLNTPAFKKSRVSFSDLVYKNDYFIADKLYQTNQTLRGMGTQITGTQKVFSAGELKATENAFDLAISGQGFFEVLMENGESAYTRSGSFVVNKDGYLATQQGYVLANRIQVSPDMTNLFISENGEVFARFVDENEVNPVGRIDLANFMNPAQLTPIGDNLYIETESSGGAFFGEGGEQGLGKIKQGFIESSNVDLVEELVELMIAQRAYQVNSQVIRAADEIMRINNNLKS